MDKINDILAKIKLPIADHGTHLHKFAFPILETAQWMTPQPIYHRELRKGNSINWRSSLFGRTDALLNPAFVTGSYHYRFFFVPYRLVQKNYQYMMERTRYTSGSVNFVPDSSRYVLEYDFISNFLNDSELASEASLNYDFTLVNNGSIKTYKLTEQGKRLYQLIRGFGYNFSFSYLHNDKIDVLPLLCWLQAYIDWFFPDQYAEVAGTYISIKRLLTEDSDRLHLEESSLLLCLKESLNLYYLDDTLSSVWDSPNVGGNYDTSDDLILADPTSSSGSSSQNVVSTHNDRQTPTIVNSVDPSEVSPLTQWAIDTLQSVNNWMLRRKLSGSRLIQRYLASHGVSIPNVNLYTCYSLVHKTLPLQIGDVENNSNTNTGELAGKGIVRTRDQDLITCDYTAEEDGIFMLVRYIMPDARIPLVENPCLRRVDYFDRFHSEFQKLGVEAVPAACVYNANDGNVNHDLVSNKTFGFAPRYWSESAEFPRLLGDFELVSAGADQLSQYHTFRKITNDDVLAMRTVHHSLEFLKTYDRMRYNRIFYNAVGSNFRNFMFCSVQLRNEKLPNGDSFDWDDDELNRRVEIVSKSNV